MKGHLSEACRKDSRRDFFCTQMLTLRNRNLSKNYNLEKIGNTALEENSFYNKHKKHGFTIKNGNESKQSEH